jgi:hypothetical protein
VVIPEENDLDHTGETIMSTVMDDGIERVWRYIAILGCIIFTAIGIVIGTTIDDDSSDLRVVTLDMNWHTPPGTDHGRTEYPVLVVDDGVRVDVEIHLLTMLPTDGRQAMDRWCELHGGERVVGTVCQGVVLALLEP